MNSLAAWQKVALTLKRQQILLLEWFKLFFVRMKKREQKNLIGDYKADEVRS